MKIGQKLVLLLAVAAVVALMLPGTALAAGQADHPHDEFVFGNTYILESGETLDGNLFIFGGAATIESGATVTGDILLMGGTLTIRGQVDGDIQITGGYVRLASSAVVNGNINSVGGYLDRDEGATVRGSITTETSGPQWKFQDFGNWRTLPRYPFPALANLDTFGILWDVFFYTLTVFVMGFLAMAIVMFWPQQTARVARAIVAQPLMTGGLGLLTALVAPAVLLVLTLTILLSPVALVGFVLLAALTVFGWVALGLEIGQRTAAMFTAEWHPAVAAGIGTFALTLLVGGVYVVFNHLCCCIGWIALLVVGCLGLGATMLSRFGTVEYPGPAGLAPAPRRPTPPAPPIPPVAAAPSAEIIAGEEVSPDPAETPAAETSAVASLDDFAAGQDEAKPKRARKKVDLT